MVELAREDGLGGAAPPGFEIEVDDPALLEDPEVLELLAKANEAAEENPLYSYLPHTRQRIFHENRVKTKAFVGGNRSGKSTATVVDCLIQAIDLDQVPDHLKGYRIWPKGTKFKCRFITPDYGKPFQSLVEAIQMWVPPSQLRGGSWETAYKDKDHILYFANGSVFDFMTTEQPSSKHGGSARHRIVWDEEPPDTEEGERIYTQARMRIADYHGDMLWGFTPISEKLGWVFDEIYEQAVEDGEEVSDRVWLNADAGLLLVQATIYENPHLSEEGREDAIAGIRADQRAAVTEGTFTSAKGLVYEEFDPLPGGAHVAPEEWIDRELVGNLEHIDGIDPGQVETAVLFAGVDKHGRVVVYDELTLSGRSAVPEHAAGLINNKRESWGLQPVGKYTVIDPAARSRGLGDGERVGEAWITAGIPVLYGKNDLEAGCMEIERRMVHQIDDGEGGLKPFSLLVISSRCTGLIKQLRKYRKQPKEDGSFGVAKKNDHKPDALRYICMERRVPVKRKRRRPREQAWTPGTAPAYNPSQERRSRGTVMGRFS
jgi:hypothetical protein